jgi:hypothetical protein
MQAKCYVREEKSSWREEEKGSILLQCQGLTSRGCSDDLQPYLAPSNLALGNETSLHDTLEPKGTLSRKEELHKSSHIKIP